MSKFIVKAGEGVVLTEYQKATQAASEIADAASKAYSSSPAYLAATTPEFLRIQSDLHDAVVARDAEIRAAWDTLQARLKTLGIDAYPPAITDNDEAHFYGAVGYIEIHRVLSNEPEETPQEKEQQ